MELYKKFRLYYLRREKCYAAARLNAGKDTGRDSHCPLVLSQETHLLVRGLTADLVRRQYDCFHEDPANINQRQHQVGKNVTILQCCIRGTMEPLGH